MPPRKKAAEEPASVPADAVILDAIRTYRELEDAHRSAYQAMMDAREHLVAVLRAAGVVGFSSL